MNVHPNEPVDLTPWAYPYVKGSASNPPETEWLWANRNLKAEKADGSLTWKYAVSPKPLDGKDVILGFIWEEARDIKRVTVGFPAGMDPLPETGDIEVHCLPVLSMWESVKPWTWEIQPVIFTQTDWRTEDDGGITAEFATDNDLTTKLYIVNARGKTNLGIPIIKAYGASVWAEPIRIEAEWGEGLPEPRAEAYNGYIANLKSVYGKNLRMRVHQTEGPGNSRTNITLHGSTGTFTISTRDLAKGPIWIPGGDLLVRMADGPTIAHFRKELAASGRKTIRERVEASPEVSAEQAMRAYFAKEEFPDFPVPEFENPVKIDVPDRFVREQWRIGAWHIRRWCMDMEDGKYCPSIWPFTKNNGGREGAAAIGAESFQILKTLDLIGLGDIADGGLKYWLDGDHAVPFIWYAENIRNDGWLFNDYNSPNHKSPGYDQKHSGGHGKILEAAAFHHRMTGSGEWLEKWRAALISACGMIAAIRAEWNKHFNDMEWSRGMIPPANGGDDGSTCLYYYLSVCWLTGLMKAAEILDDPAITAESEAFQRDLVRAAAMSAALSPVIRVRDGTYRRYVPHQPYVRGSTSDIDWNMTSNGLLMAPDIMDPRDPIIRGMLDIHEDVFHSMKVPEPPEGDEWIANSGHGYQGGHEAQKRIYLAADDIGMYLRTVFTSYAAEVSPDNGYVFYEGPDCAGAIDKTFEEASFLMHVRNMLLYEENGNLWIAKAAPRAWFAPGKRIAVEGAPTFFGKVTFEITSEADRIRAVIILPDGNAPQELLVRFRHPDRALMKRATVNGADWSGFDPERETIVIRNPEKGRIEVIAEY